MEYKNFGATDTKISAVGIGTWKMGADVTGELGAIRGAMDAGINLIDTAEMYGTERIVSEAIRGRGRDALFIATKVSPHNLHYRDVLKACEASLSRLGVDYVDLYQVHWPNHSIPVSETMRAMEELLDSGKIRNIGVSNFTEQEMEEAQSALKRAEIASNQVEYSVIARHIEDGLLDYCRRNGHELIAYSPFGSGALFRPQYRPVMDELSAIGRERSVTAQQVALSWIVGKGATPIPKASSAAHAEEDAKAAGLRLSPEEVSRIDEVSARYQKAPLGGVFRGLLKRTGFWSRMMTKPRVGE